MFIFLENAIEAKFLEQKNKQRNPQKPLSFQDDFVRSNLDFDLVKSIKTDLYHQNTTKILPR